MLKPFWLNKSLIKNIQQQISKFLYLLTFANSLKTVFSVKQSIPVISTFPNVTEELTKKNLLNRRSPKEQVTHEDRVEFVCRGTSKILNLKGLGDFFKHIPTYVETSPSSLFNLPRFALQHSSTSHS